MCISIMLNNSKITTKCSNNSSIHNNLDSYNTKTTHHQKNLIPLLIKWMKLICNLEPCSYKSSPSVKTYNMKESANKVTNSKPLEDNTHSYPSYPCNKNTKTKTWDNFKAVTGNPSNCCLLM